jgi:putative ubiquitin-RnfH superfamily antitoxin RatB of RatAB toxin-antitoxin module
LSARVAIEVVFADIDRIYIDILHFSYEPQVIEIISNCRNIPEPARAFTATVWGKRVTESTVLRNNDRLELTREIVADPKHSRARKVNALPRRGWVQRLR